MNDPKYPKHPEVLSRFECPVCHGERKVPCGIISWTSCDRCIGEGWVSAAAPPTLSAKPVRYDVTICRKCRDGISSAANDRGHDRLFHEECAACMHPAHRTEPTGIEAMVCADIAARQRVGIKKYGRTVAESTDDFKKHLYEELLDAAIYLKAEMERRGR